MNSRLVKLALTFLVSALSAGITLANPLTLNADLHFENGATLGGSFTYDPGTNKITQWDLTSFAFGVAHEFVNTDSTAGAGIFGPPVIGNPDNDQVFSFSQSFNSPAADIYTLNLVIGCGGVADCIGVAGANMAFPLLGGQQTCATNPCASSGEETFAAPLPTQYLNGTSGSYFAVADPPMTLLFYVSSTIPDGFTLFNPNGGGGSVPEPGTLALCSIVGLVSLLGSRRRKS